MKYRVISHVRRQAVGYLALFVALGGTGYAAFSLPKNSVGTKQLKNKAVTTSKIKNGAVTASKINSSGLTVRNALHAKSANTAGSAAPSGPAGGDLTGSYPAPRIAGAAAPIAINANPQTSTDPCFNSQPGFFCGNSSAYWGAPLGLGQTIIQFWRDRLGEVHVRGQSEHYGSTATTPGSAFFLLPPGYRPAVNTNYPIFVSDAGGANQRAAQLSINTNGLAQVEVALSTPAAFANIGEIQFRTDQ